MQKLFVVLFAALVSMRGFAAETGDFSLVADIAHRWAEINYQTPAAQQEAAFKALAEQAHQLSATNPTRAEPKVWEAIVLASYAKANGGLGALSSVRQARELLLAASRIDPDTLNGSVYTSLGSLYAKVPGWPLGFGDKDTARHYLDLALHLNPNGIDSNYFYGDLLASQGDYAGAVQHLQKALAAPARPGREDADAGRRKEIQQLLATINAEHGSQLSRK
jgi:tetratricopeptide (TPR) repeat protein